MLRQGKLHEQGVLEMLLPQNALEEQPSRSTWAKHITEMCSYIESELDPRANSLMKMSWVFACVQRLKLFGAQYWLAEQVSFIPPEKISVPEAPREMMRIDPDDKSATAEYFICLDIWGLRLLPLDYRTPFPGR